MSLRVVKVATKPYTDQIPGTSGLRKLTKVYQQENYIENFTQSILLTVGPQLQSCSLLIGGDGRYLSKEAAEKIVRICAGNGVSTAFVGQHGRFSTPAAAHFIEKYRLAGAIILTASHNPGGPDADFGIKFNGSNGGPATPLISAKIAEYARTISHYNIVPNLRFDTKNIGTEVYDISGKTFTIKVVDFIDDYVEMTKELFDFDALRNLLLGDGRRERFRICLDAMHAITGPYLERIFVEELQIPPDSLRNTKPLEDFKGHHPDPNLTNAHDLVEFMETHPEYGFAAAFDGDGDRNMILGQRGLFITPSDSLAVLADNIRHIPYFKDRRINGFGRSMPTSSAIDRVAKAKNIPLHVTPTGWKYFVELISNEQISICGEESFGYDYEKCDTENTKQLIAQLEENVQKKSLVGSCMSCKSAKAFSVQRVEKFSYTSPIDGISVSDGYRVFLSNGGLCVVRLSGTGSTGATIRVYFECFEDDPATFAKTPKEMLHEVVGGFIKFLRIKEFTGREKPTVIT